MKNIKLIIEDRGDMSCGIFPTEYKIQTPFNVENGLTFEVLKSFKDTIIPLYTDFIEGKMKVYYDFELKIDHVVLLDDEILVKQEDFDNFIWSNFKKNDIVYCNENQYYFSHILNEGYTSYIFLTTTQL